jgi:hypothetical protein
MIVPDSRIPFRIRIGVTGHRRLNDVSALAASVSNIISSRYEECFGSSDRAALHNATATPIAFTVVSPLAEGADRLIAQAVMEKGGRLEALLPMPAEEYRKDFRTAGSLEEFDCLLKKAHRVSVNVPDASPSDREARKTAYRKVGELVVDRTDLVIALWDGESARGIGGTAEIVEYAKRKKKPVFIVSTANPGAVELMNGGLLQAKYIVELNRFNALNIPAAKEAEYAANVRSNLFDSPAAASLPDHLKKVVTDHLVPFYCRASIIAKHNQDRYHRVGKSAYLFSTFAVAFMAGAVVFGMLPALALPGYLIELALLITLYVMIHRASHAGVHKKWLENRMLTERIRNAFYFVGCGVQPLYSAKAISIHRHERSWMDHVYHEVVGGLSAVEELSGESIGYCTDFVREKWVKEQTEYHRDKAAKCKRRNESLKRSGMACFVIAIIVSVVHHVLAIKAVYGHHLEGALLLFEQVLSVIAITLPAAGAATNGYRSLREYSRIGSRSQAMVHNLEGLENHPPPQSPAELRHYLEKMEKLMLMESHDWIALMEHAELENIA